MLVLEKDSTGQVIEWYLKRRDMGVPDWLGLLSI